MILYVLAIGSFPFMEQSQRSNGQKVQSLANIILKGLVLPRHKTELASVSILLRFVPIHNTTYTYAIKNLVEIIISTTSLLIFRSLIMRCLEVKDVRRISAVGIINDPWIILGTSRFGRPNTFGKRKNFYAKEQIISEMKRQLSIPQPAEFILQHLKVPILSFKNVIYFVF